MKNPEERASSEELLAHPFVAADVRALNEAKPKRGFSQDLLELVDSCVDEILLFREEEALRQANVMQTLRKSLGPGDTAVLRDGTLVKQTRGGTARTLQSGTPALPPRTPPGAGGNEDGTLLLMGGNNATLNNSTLLVSPPPGTAEPDFMAYFHSVTAPGSAAVMKLEKSQQEFLERSVSRLNAQFRADFAELKKQYEKRKQALLLSASSTAAGGKR